MIYKLVAWIVQLGTGVLCRIDAPDIHTIPMRGPLIVISNHTGWAKVEAWDNAFLNGLFNLWGVIPIRRGEGDTSALRKALKALDDGYIFGIAPEGTRNITGKLQRAHPGAVMLATHSGATILPVAHWGGENFLKNLSRLKRTDFHIRVGTPFRLKVEGKRVTREVRQQIADEMMVRIAELMPLAYHGAYKKVSNSDKSLTEEVKLY